MHILHPLDFIPKERRRPVFWIALFLTSACFAIFQLFLSPPANTTGVPSDIVSFELAGSTTNAREMVNTWSFHSKLLIALGLGFDFLFMPVYATALSLGSLMAAGRLRGVWSRAGNIIGWAAYGAVIFDAIENIALFAILTGDMGNHPQIAFWCASIKFGLIGLSLIYGLYGWLFGKKP